MKRTALNFIKAFCRSSIGKLLIMALGAALFGAWGLVLFGLAALLAPRLFPRAFESRPRARSAAGRDQPGREGLC